MSSLDRFSEPGRPEFRSYRPTKKQMAQWLNTMAKIYNEIHRNDPEWLHPMKEDYDEINVVAGED